MHFNPRTIAFAAVASLLALAILRAADAPKAAGLDDDKALQGSWVIDSAEFKATRSPELVGSTLTFAAGKVSLSRKDKERPSQSAYVLRPSSSPKEIELTPLDDSGKADGSKTIRGIYRLEGDTLRICMNDRAGPDPTPVEFKTDKYSNDVLLVLTRQK